MRFSYLFLAASIKCYTLFDNFTFALSWNGFFEQNFFLIGWFNVVVFPFDLRQNLRSFFVSFRKMRLNILAIHMEFCLHLTFPKQVIAIYCHIILSEKNRCNPMKMCQVSEVNKRL